MYAPPPYMPEEAVFPFTAIVGQENMKLALILNAINPAIGGVLIRGEKGTAKSTAVRALSRLLPEIDVAGCPYGCDPRSLNLCEDCRRNSLNGNPPTTTRRRVRVVDLPGSATEDRVVGTLDLEAALREGKRRFEPGLLAQAHRGILYVDEVNLLDDHLVDTLLDAAAMGVNRVEREGVSFQHPAEFILVGTMNPEEGEVRPQLLDRFGLAVEIRASRDPDDRVQIMRRRMAFEADPLGFPREWEQETLRIARRIEAARHALPNVETPLEMLRLTSQIAVEAGVDGHRADLVICRAAATLAAFEGRTVVTAPDVKRAAELALPHRRTRRPPDSFGGDGRESSPAPLELESPHAGAGPASPDINRFADQPGLGPARESVKGPDPLFDPPFIAAPAPHSTRPQNRARRIPVESPNRRGRWTRSSPVRLGDRLDVALKDTLLQAALRNGRAGPAIPSDLRIKRRVSRAGHLFLFLVDASGSMGAQRRMSAAKSAVLSLLKDAHLRRDRVGLVAFRQARAELVLPPSASSALAVKAVEGLPTGGRTPLARGLEFARGILKAHVVKQPNTRPVLILLSDGLANVPLWEGSNPIEDALAQAEALARDRIPAIVVDAGPKRGPIRLLPELARRLAGRHVSLEALVSGAAGRWLRLAAPGG